MQFYYYITHLLIFICLFCLFYYLLSFITKPITFSFLQFMYNEFNTIVMKFLTVLGVYVL